MPEPRMLFGLVRENTYEWKLQRGYSALLSRGPQSRLRGVNEWCVLLDETAQHRKDFVPGALDNLRVGFSMLPGRG